ncbi:TonB-dependent receptor [Pseudomonas sp. SWI6]|uniref:TonB-dependent siderophore receptor n=1 Tax=Pseudomonas TaxID=286 RepID=UPI0003C0765D|nr:MULTISPECIES: TonB-dependent receptor [unclassified Pseudomonas]AGZ33626.1 TonB-dependent siderophore receptor [Pseudomonas sp. VLB120]AVD84790.1 TonB-dependent receptor [Pseudomonas sp. SWI6]AVD87017.1 TonB-dependent receptor [Pseudomonas sp. SWI44]QQZ37124.1 TonB-dependent receptor [Pseudomonas sp. SK2]
MKFTPRCIPLCFGLAALGAVPVAPLVQAAEQVQLYAFAQPSQPLAQAINAFSRATGQSVVYTLELPVIQAPALNGSFSAEQALQQLLGNSGLTWRRVDARTLTLEPMDTSGALNLQATTVTSQMDTHSYQPPAVASIMRGQGPTQDIPQAINVVPAQVIRDQAPRNLDDALTNVSGITQGNNFGGTADTVMKRGFGDNRDGSIMRDGMPIVQGRSLNASAERIEVLKGPASLLYGIQDPGGVINVVSKRPQLEQYNALTVRGSTYGSGKNGSGGGFDSTGALGDSQFAYRLIVDHEDEDYWRNYGVHRESLVAPSLAWLGEDTQVVLAYEHREFLYPFDRGTAFGSDGHPLNIPATRRLDEPFNDMQGRSDLYRLEVDHQLADDWKLHVGYSFNRETYDASQVRVTGVNEANGTLKRSIDGTHNAMSRDQFVTVSLNGNVELAGMQHDLLLGADHEDRKIFRGDLIRQSSQSTFSYLNPVYGQEVEGSTVRASDSDQTDKLRTDALFFQDALHLDDHWILVAGARFQQYDQYAGRGRPFKANTDTSGQAWVPHAGIVYKVDEQLSFYGSYSESFKPNSSIAPLTGGLVLDSSIAPEEGKSWEIGAKLDVPGKLTGTLALFDITKRNVLVANFDTSSGETVYSNAGEVGSRGVELDLTGQLSERWSLIGSYAYTDAEVTKDPELKGNRLQNVAKHSGSLSAVYDFGSLFGGDNLRLGTGVRYVGERAGNATNTFDLPSYTVADAFASYETKLDEHKVRLQLNVKNLFDKVYYSSAVNQYFVAIGDARQVSLSSTLEF